MVYAKFGGQTECIMGNSKIENSDDWLKQISHVAPPIRSSTQIWVVTRHQYGISAIVS